jgi:hypothetical protein
MDSSYRMNKCKKDSFGGVKTTNRMLIMEERRKEFYEIRE